MAEMQLTVSDEIHKNFKIMCVQQDITMTEKIEQFMEKEVEIWKLKV